MMYSSKKQGDGQFAVTHYKVLERFDKYTLIECRLETGRTHQIRVHLSHIGYPIIGDGKYGINEINITKGPNKVFCIVCPISCGATLLQFLPLKKHCPNSNPPQSLKIV